MKHFFPGIIAQDIRKAKSENIELFKNALNKLLNFKNYFIIKGIHYYMRSGITPKFIFAIHYIYSKLLRKLWRLAPSSDGNFNRTKSTTTTMTFLKI